MKDFFLGIESLFEEVLFLPFDYLRLTLQPDSWLAANMVNMLIMGIGFIAFFYWLGQLKKFSKTENTNSKEESYLI